MLETTKEERERAWSNGPKSFLARVIRDVDTLVGIVRKLEGCADWESEDAATLNVTEFKIALEEAREVLRESATPAAPGTG